MVTNNLMILVYFGECHSNRIAELKTQNMLSHTVKRNESQKATHTLTHKAKNNKIKAEKIMKKYRREKYCREKSLCIYIYIYIYTYICIYVYVFYMGLFVHLQKFIIYLVGACVSNCTFHIDIFVNK